VYQITRGHEPPTPVSQEECLRSAVAQELLRALPASLGPCLDCSAAGAGAAACRVAAGHAADLPPGPGRDHVARCHARYARVRAAATAAAAGAGAPPPRVASAATSRAPRAGGDEEAEAEEEAGLGDLLRPYRSCLPEPAGPIGPADPWEGESPAAFDQYLTVIGFRAGTWTVISQCPAGSRPRSARAEWEGIEGGRASCNLRE
jgi:hypothetical protein